jgi:hypothetical protein
VLGGDAEDDESFDPQPLRTTGAATAAMTASAVRRMRACISLSLLSESDGPTRLERDPRRLGLPLQPFA